MKPLTKANGSTDRIALKTCMPLHVCNNVCLLSKTQCDRHALNHTHRHMLLHEQNLSCGI